MLLLDLIVKAALTLQTWNWHFSSPEAAARHILSKYPLIDLHIDLPVVLRYRYGNDLAEVDYRGPLPLHLDLDRLESGLSSGFFSIAFVPCTGDDHFTTPTNQVRDTLEQIDLTHQLPLFFKEVALADEPQGIRRNFREGKKSHLIGIEGAHSLGNSLATLRTFHKLGVRYLTLTHTCHNAFADASGSTTNVSLPAFHGGLSPFGDRLVDEMNRLGIMVDVSHTSDDTARQAIRRSKAPVIFSHSGARSIHNHVRNVPDDILASLKNKEALIGIPFLPSFLGLEGNTSVKLIADHIEHIVSLTGKDKVAIGSDFDGFIESPIPGMEDVSKYPNLLAELYSRGWTAEELGGLVGENFLRIFQKVLDVAKDLQKEGKKPDMSPWKGRPDLGKGRHWFSPTIPKLHM